MNEPVTIIILNYNGKHFLKKCLDSILKQSYESFDIIFFDNNSTDGSVDYVRGNIKDPRLKINESKTNLGYAGGCNEAIKNSSNDLTVLLNNDTETEKDWLKNLVEAVREKNTVASSFVKTRGIDPKYYETNGSVSYCMYNVMNIFENIEDEFYPNGCSLIFRKSEIPVPFDDDYFYYSEDLYMGLKARFMGMKIKFAKDSVVHHYGGGTDSPGKMRTFYRERNRFLNLYLFFSFWFLVRVLPIIAIVKTGRLIQAIFSKKISFPGILKAYIWFYLQIPALLNKRKELSKLKRVDEKEVIKNMTSKLLNHESMLSKLINYISYYYSRLVGLKPIEYYQHKS